MEQYRVTKSLAALYFLWTYKLAQELKQRSPIEIMNDILGAAATPVTKTRLMYHARLYNRQVNPYFSVLLKAGLLEKNDEGKYRTTAKGRDFMQSYERLQVIVALPASQNPG